MEHPQQRSQKGTTSPCLAIAATITRLKATRPDCCNTTTTASAEMVTCRRCWKTEKAFGGTHISVITGMRIFHRPLANIFTTVCAIVTALHRGSASSPAWLLLCFCEDNALFGSGFLVFLRDPPRQLRHHPHARVPSFRPSAFRCLYCFLSAGDYGFSQVPLPRWCGVFCRCVLIKYLLIS
jgi:hypothetical protein